MDALTATGRSLVHFAAKEAEREEVTFFIKWHFPWLGFTVHWFRSTAAEWNIIFNMMAQEA